MLGVGSSKREMCAALVLAVVVHGLLLLIRFSYQPMTQVENQVLTVNFQSEQQTAPNLVTDEQQAEDPQVVDPKPKQAPAKATIVLQAADDSKEPTIAIQTSINSNAFKRLIQQETDDYREANPSSVSEFSKTFDEVTREVEEIPLMNKEGLAEAARTGVFMSQDKHGNRRCFASASKLLSGGGHAESLAGVMLGKDCTPKKKFELNLNKPNNGWMDR